MADEEAPEAPPETSVDQGPTTAEDATAGAKTDAENESAEIPVEAAEQGDAITDVEAPSQISEEPVEREGRTRFDEVVVEKEAPEEHDAAEDSDNAEDFVEKLVQKSDSDRLTALPSGFEFVTTSKSKEFVSTAEKTTPDSKFKMALGSIISIRRTSLGDVGYDKKVENFMGPTIGRYFNLQIGLLINLFGNLNTGHISIAARYMNTYRLDSQNPFNAEQVEKVLVSVMTEALENLTYDAEKCAKQAKWASSAIRAKVKDFKFERYKFICIVSIGEKNSQDVLATCRFLWDIERDRYATFALENTFVYGFAQCFGVYYE